MAVWYNVRSNKINDERHWPRHEYHCYGNDNLGTGRDAEIVIMS